MSESELDLPNARAVSDGVLSTGQPTRAHLEAARQAGTRTLINLRPAGEFSEFDEAAFAADLGLRYIHIPVAGPQDLSRENAQALDRALSDEQATPAIVHCGSGNRVGALFALRARYVAGLSLDRALQAGVDAGLNPESKLYPATRQALE